MQTYSYTYYMKIIYGGYGITAPWLMPLSDLGDLLDFWNLSILSVYTGMETIEPEWLLGSHAVVCTHCVVKVQDNNREPGSAYSKRVPALIVHSELKSVHPGFPVAFIF